MFVCHTITLFAVCWYYILFIYIMYVVYFIFLSRTLIGHCCSLFFSFPFLYLHLFNLLGKRCWYIFNIISTGNKIQYSHIHVECLYHPWWRNRKYQRVPIKHGTGDQMDLVNSWFHLVSRNFPFPPSYIISYSYICYFT